jgi:hypothetical protein
MSKTPKIVRDVDWGMLEGAGYESLREMFSNMYQETRIGPFIVKEEASDGGQGQGESAWFVYQVIDTRDNTVEFVKADVGYYSYDGYQWNDFNMDDLQVVEKQQVQIWDWVPV